MVRAWGAALVCLLTLQAGAAALLERAARPACCCHHAEAGCRCPVCAHQRELEQDSPVLKTCGPSGVAPAIAVADPALPAGAAGLPQPAMWPLARSPADPFESVPPSEVPTPPPLA